VKHLLVTGANGFIGSNLCRYFLERGWRVDGLVRESSDLRFLEGLDVRLVFGDLREPGRIPFPADATFVVHAAALVSDMACDEECGQNIFDTSLNLVTGLKAAGAPLRRFVYISSALTLGFDGLDISEERPGRSAEFMPYVRHKIRSERALMAEHAAGGLPLVILRPGDVFGPNDRVTSANLLRGCERKAPLIVGHGRWRFGYCYVGNLCRAAELVLTGSGVEGRAYTVTNRVLPTWRDFFSALQSGLGRKQRIYVPVRFAFAVAGAAQALYRVFPRMERELNYYRIKRITTETTYDISRTVSELGYDPDDDFGRQFAEVVAWYQEEKARGRMA
jgi:nucleoside-diphosphate-sugar epimerase